MEQTVVLCFIKLEIITFQKKIKENKNQVSEYTLPYVTV